MSDHPIGIFDSGIGGLTVVKEMRRILPGENIIYLGDTARLPYGTKSVDAIIDFSLENTEFLIARGAKYIVIACYSSTSVALDIIRKKVSVPVIGVIQPGVEKAVEMTENRKIGVIGTSLTIFSGAYEKAFRKLDDRCEVLGRACPLFVPLVEEGWLDHEATDLIARVYLKPLKDDGVDTLLLGCTHFPLLMPVFKKIMGKINYVDAAREVGVRVAADLRKMELERLSKQGSLKIYLTDLSMNFKDIGERFLGEPMKNFSRVTLGGIQ
jgi:glutamate racemase